MATAKLLTKPTPKTAPKKRTESVLVQENTISSTPKGQQFAMPMEVKEWIDRANSTINHLKGQIARLTEENNELKSYRRWAEQRILRSEAE